MAKVLTEDEGTAHSEQHRQAAQASHQGGNKAPCRSLRPSSLAAATRSASWTRAPLTSHVGLEDRQLALATSWRGWRIALVRAAMLRFAQGVDTLARVFGTLWYYR